MSLVIANGVAGRGDEIPADGNDQLRQVSAKQYPPAFGHRRQQDPNFWNKNQEGKSMIENIFNEFGMLRADIEHVQVAPERKPMFDALVSAVKSAERAEATVKSKDEAVARAVKVHAHAVATMPRSSFMDEWRASAGQAPVRSRIGTAAAAPLSPNDAENALGMTQQELRDARTALAGARVTVAKCLANYNAETPTITAEQNARNYIASENARRQAVAEGRARPAERTKPGPSYIDRVAFYGTHGGADDAVRGRFRNGGSHRGAFGKHMQGAFNTDPRRGPVAKTET